MLKLVSKADNFYQFQRDEKSPVIGQFALVNQDVCHELKLVAFSIDGKYRNKKYGQQMLVEAIEKANQIRGNRILSLDVIKNNAAALHIYQKYGFEIAGDFCEDVFHMVYKLSEQPYLQVANVECTERRQFYDSQWVVKFKNGSWCKLTRYDDESAIGVIHAVEKCRCIAEVQTKCDLRSQILYD